MAKPAKNTAKVKEKDKRIQSPVLKLASAWAFNSNGELSRKPSQSKSPTGSVGCISCSVGYVIMAAEGPITLDANRPSPDPDISLDDSWSEAD
jgi:hypothetical protein